MKALETEVFDGLLLQSTRYVVLDRALALAGDSSAPPGVRSDTIRWLGQLKEKMNDFYMNEQLQVFQRDPKQLEMPRAVEPPPGPANRRG
ncbi:MAG: hypothetical protein M3Y72_10585 [Acidobacteriota bacterium]|nr:hypothetical protein [Acidobacteriota bacterium]